MNACDIPASPAIYSRAVKRNSWRKVAHSLPLIYFCAMVFAYMAIIVAFPHPPMLQDYPTWVYEGVAVSHIFASHPDPQFTLRHYPVPNVLSDVCLGVLSTAMSWQRAAKLWLCIYLLFSGAACLHFLRRTGSRSHEVYWIAPTVMLANLCFWYGSINFQFALAMAVVFCSMLLPEASGVPAVGTLLALIFLSHAVPFLVCCAVLFSYILYNKAYKLLLAYTPSVLLGVFYLYGRFILSGNREKFVLHDVPIPYISKTFLLYKINTYFKSLGYVNPISGSTSFTPALVGSVGMYCLVAITALLGVLLLGVFLASGRDAFRRRLHNRFLWVAIVGVAFAAMLSPSETLGISDPGARFMACALTLAALISKPLGKVPRAAFKIASAASVVLGVAGVYLFFGIARDPGQVMPPRHAVNSLVAKFAHVSPTGRAFYYQEIVRGKMTDPVFDTALLLNRAPEEGGLNSKAPAAQQTTLTPARDR